MLNLKPIALSRKNDKNFMLKALKRKILVTSLHTVRCSNILLPSVFKAIIIWEFQS